MNIRLRFEQKPGRETGECMIAIQKEDVDIGALITAAKKHGTGAIVVFDGIVRDDDIIEMELEAYQDVATQELEKIARDATHQFNLLHVISSIGSDASWLVRTSLSL